MPLHPRTSAPRDLVLEARHIEPCRAIARALLALSIIATTAHCRRTEPEAPLARLRRERLAAVSAMDLPVARSARTPALRPHLRVVLTANGVDVDSSELSTDPHTSAATTVTLNAAVRQGDHFRPEDVRGGAAGFLVTALRESLLAHAARCSSGEVDRAAIRVAVYAERSTPTRILYQTIYTLSQAGFVAVHIAMKRGGEIVAIPLAIERDSRPRDDAHCSELLVQVRDAESLVRRSPPGASGSTSASQAAADRAARAAERELRAIAGLDPQATAEPEPVVEQRVANINGAPDIPAIRAAIRSLTSDASVRLCGAPMVSTTSTTGHGVSAELREMIEYDLGLSSSTMGITL
ncbi:MAG: hypothetical protein U0269_14760 [Polyangiales bacterium]